MTDETEGMATEDKPILPIDPLPPVKMPTPNVESSDAKAVREHRERLEEADRKRGW